MTTGFLRQRFAGFQFIQFFCPLVCLLAIACPAASAQDGPFVYVPNSSSNNASVIDTPTNTVVPGTIATGATPVGAGVRGDESLIYVANQADNTVSVINTGTNTAIATIAVGNGPVAVAVSPDGQTAYVTNGGNNTVSVINTSTNTVAATIAVGSTPQQIAVTPDGKLALISNFNGNSVSVVNTGTNTVVATVGVGTGPAGVSITPDGKTAYVTNFSSNTVSVINVATNAVIGTIGVGAAPFGVAVTPDGTLAYVVNVNSATITAINTSTNTVFATFPVGNLPRGVAFSPDGKYAYVTNLGDNSVSVVDTTTRLTIATLPVGTTPSALPGVCSNGNALLASGLTFVARTSGAIGCTGAAGPTFTGGTLQIAGTTISTSLPISLQAQGGTIDTNGNIATLSGSITGPGGLTKVGAGVLTLSGSNSYTGGTTINAGTLALAAGGTLGASTNSLAINGGTLDLGTTAQTQNGGVTQAGGTIQNGMLNTAVYQMSGGILAASATVNASTSFDLQAGTVNGVLSGAGALSKTTSGMVTLSGVNTYTGATNVNGGILDVEGSITTSSLATVNSGALFMGTGSVGNVLVANGGQFEPGSGAPGSSMTVTGNLAFQSGALYIVQLNPTTASFANVAGAAALNGATSAFFASGNYVAKSYTILSAAGGVNGTFNSLINTNLPSNFNAALEYDATHVYLDLSLKFVPPPNSGLTVNQQNVANAIVGFFNRNNGVPLVYGSLTPAGLTQASGEAATGTQQTTLDAMNLFVALLTDPFVAGRADTFGLSSSQFAQDPLNAHAAVSTASKAERQANASPFTKAPQLDGFAQKWSVWAAGLGQSQTVDGSASVGSNTLTSRVYATAVGADYKISPFTLAGFALAGGGTSFAVANGLGAGRSDLFQAGAFLRHTIGPAFLSGALAYGWQDVTTDRTVTVAGIDQLGARFNANAASVRVEGGYRFVHSGLGITPYAAGQYTNLLLPAYSEQVLAGSDTFGLDYSSKSLSDSRSELGLRTDSSFLFPDSVLTVRGRAAWTHEFDTDRVAAAVFQALPGASFLVSGAIPARDAALLTGSAELKWSNGISLSADLEGEFSANSSSYGGRGVVRYAW